ncbi:WDR70 family WD repeat protein [Schizosaccharomyces pombe]
MDGTNNTIPLQFGKQAQTYDINALIARFIRPKESFLINSVKKESESKLNSKSTSSQSSDSEDWDSEENEDDITDVGVPGSHEIMFPGHSKIVTTTTFDKNGSRFYTGSLDNTIHCWDLNGLSATNPHPFKIIDPTDTNADNVGRYPVSKLSCSTKNQILALYTHSQPILYDRDGSLIVRFSKGDQYIRNMYNTKGHIAEITDGCWQPDSSQIFLTTGYDSTARIWDVNRTKSQLEVFVHVPEGSHTGLSRIPVTSCAWNPAKPDNFATAVLDGSIQFWQKGSRTKRPVMKIKDAHLPQQGISCLSFSQDGNYLLSRGEDNALRVWDLRNSNKCVNERIDILTPKAGGNAIFSPTQKLILAGSTAVNSMKAPLFVLDAMTLDTKATLFFDSKSTVTASVSAVSWNEKINQVSLGSADGNAYVLFSPNESIRGVKDAAMRPPKSKHIDDDLSSTVHINSLSGSAGTSDFGLVEETTESASAYFLEARRRRNAVRKDPKLSRQPQVGRLLEENSVDDIPLATMLNEDPREALLKYADVAKSNPMFTKMYSETQPTPIYQGVTEGDISSEEGNPSKKQKR